MNEPSPKDIDYGEPESEEVHAHEVAIMVEALLQNQKRAFAEGLMQLAVPEPGLIDQLVQVQALPTPAYIYAPYPALEGEIEL